MGALARLPQPAADPVWLSPAQVAAKAPGLTVENLTEMRSKRRGPTYYKPTLKTVLYLESEVDAWIAATRVQTTNRDA